jgi:hypothetical protein
MAEGMQECREYVTDDRTSFGPSSCDVDWLLENIGALDTAAPSTGDCPIERNIRFARHHHTILEQLRTLEKLAGRLITVAVRYIRDSLRTEWGNIDVGILDSKVMDVYTNAVRGFLVHDLDAQPNPDIKKVLIMSEVPETRRSDTMQGVTAVPIITSEVPDNRQPGDAPSTATIFQKNGCNYNLSNKTIAMENGEFQRFLMCTRGELETRLDRPFNEAESQEYNRSFMHYLEENNLTITNNGEIVNLGGSDSDDDDSDDSESGDDGSPSEVLFYG